MKTTSDKLTQAFKHEQVLSKQQSESEQKLLLQQVSSLEAIISSQEKEIKRLQSDVANANQQLTSIAKRAVGYSEQNIPSKKSVVES